MSKLLLNVNRLINPTDDFIQLFNLHSIKYRIIVQFLDAVVLNEDNFTMIVQNLAEFDNLRSEFSNSNKFITSKDKLSLNMDLGLYQYYFVNDNTKLNIQTGEPLSINIICWKSDSNNMTINFNQTIKWEILNMSKLNLIDIQELKNFILSPSGKEFIEL